jgi:hypothetical protein
MGLLYRLATCHTCSVDGGVRRFVWHPDVHYVCTRACRWSLCKARLVHPTVLKRSTLIARHFVKHLKHLVVLVFSEIPSAAVM